MKLLYTLTATVLFATSVYAQTPSLDYGTGDHPTDRYSAPVCDLVPEADNHSQVEFLKNSLVSFTSRDKRFHVEFGGRVEARVAYDFDGIINHMDFIPAAIEMNSPNDQKFRIDASTCVFHVQGHVDAGRFGPIEFFVSNDFRGGEEDHYIPRIRSAYVAFKGFLIGRHAKTFCDMDSSPITIDFEMPNAFTYNFGTQVRWTYRFAKKHLEFGVAIEMPNVTGTYNEHFSELSQRTPDVPIYLQYEWGKELMSHVRLSGLLRNLYYRNNILEKNQSQFAWAAQLSGHLRPCRALDIYMTGIYGRGFSDYVLDLIGSGLDFTPDPQDPTQMIVRPMWSWQAGVQVNLSKRVFVTGGYSEADVDQMHSRNDQYQRGQYIFGNVFYDLTPHFTLAGEYLYGSRENMSGEKNHANRIQMMVKYKF